MAKSNPKNTKPGGAPPPPKEKVVKKNSGCFIGILLLLLLIALLLFLMKHFGFGFFGDGDGDGDGSGSGSGTSASDTLIDGKGMEENIVNVTVLGNEYIYDNSKIELTDFIAEVKKADGKVIVHINDDNAYQDTMQALIDELEKESIEYTGPSATVDD